MSLRRRSRFPAGSARKPSKAERRKPAPRQEWDSTIHDLSVLRATPEDIAIRHEMHKSKNRALAHLELQEKSLENTRNKLRPRAPQSVEKKKLDLMRAIISDQYQLHDVLEGSDQAMAVVKDLFGDAPHWHLGFPNVTVAPDHDVESSEDLIVQKCDLPTQLSILSESVMDPQALNEKEECSFVCNTNSEGGVYLNTRSNIDTKRVLNLLKEDNSVANCQPEASKQHISTVSTEEVDILLTPAASFQSLEHTALNATHVVKKVHSRFQNEEQTADTPCTIQQVLNAKVKKQKHTSTKVKKKQTAQTPTGQTRINLNATSASVNGQNSSLEYLNQMLHDLEHDIEEYERWMGHEVQYVHSREGVSGFTHSLVHALNRMLHCLKQTETKVRQEIINRQQLERELSEHRVLIDALTAEILLMREENFAMQSTFQRNLAAQDEQSRTGVPHATESHRIADYGKTKEFSVRSSKATKENPIPDCTGAKMEMSDCSSKNAVLLHPPDKTYPASLVSACIFQPAVMLSPPLQKSSESLPLVQGEYATREQNEEQKPFALHESPVVQENGSPFVQRGGGPVATKSLQNYHCSDDHLSVETFSAEVGQDLGDFLEKFCPGAPMVYTQNDDFQKQIVELILQNSIIKSQLNKFRHCCQETSSNLQQLDTKQDGSMEEQGESQAKSRVKEFPRSLDERIAELNRQSAEARDKLLLLTNQQRLSTSISVSPPISPIPSPLVNLTEKGRRTIEVSVPVSETLDSSKEEIRFPAYGANARREAYNKAAITEDSRENRRKQEPTNLNTCLPQSISLGNVHLRNNNHRTKTENQKEEGWFALSTHFRQYQV
ncbi:spindle and centriole-associated protein 1 isoform X2 [Anolis carolinensis]|uniref:spindle and centriole-associated protein 1 isoform X2 n=1 Tax=Anolis carolinensis TaxID=28377 RepID=UPI000462CDE2|nr:PREDICTED: spindle and centriole-associated protein 1 isoform X2 [Anolis carolinensis]|eukprot:XP_008118674.1 PREDICTED: spindle and centriole-associated protein 1 isoform X2 [Anolis carolinensis]